jgi:hypothetical protein
LAARVTDEIDDGDDGDVQWTLPARQGLLVAADELAAAVRGHADALAAMGGGAAEMSALFDAHDLLARVAAGYTEAVFGLTGTFVRFDDDLLEAEEDGEDEDEPDDWSTGVSVLRREDYAVTDEPRVVAEGRTAYLQSWPDETDEDAAAAVPGVGRALHEVMHARGSGALEDVAGLQQVGSHTVIVGTEGLADPEDRGDDPFLPFGPGQEVLLVDREP